MDNFLKIIFDRIIFTIHEQIRHTKTSWGTEPKPLQDLPV